ncbi:GntR family transcriptional regulator [Alkalihalobacterium alkalinitrilicum]|uniref:GntR family transcriptional regulator n=1 Tax=Alkalihalobacterium alkalinitrilicum TaxID=427920 RepID=UPI000994C59D|nr:GntR family transcriptional regulator [Alkalihalobacterium alkalinitrilicum]
MVSYHPLKVKQSSYEKIANIIRKDIMLGRWEYGAHLNEKKIAEEFSISRGPVRDALMLLGKEGVIETPSNGRTIVIGFNEKNFNDWSKVRLYLESFAIKEGLNKDPLNDIKLIELDAIIKEMEKVDNLETHIYLDLLFHREIIAFSENRTLGKLWDTLSGTLATMLELIANNYDNQKQIVMHREIFEAIKMGDAERACFELEGHVNEGNRAIKSVIKFIDKNDSNNS